ncbi:hypothetical protein BJ741DRAFT_535712, partial [Chytriomyces cf. hyalinus JEL632]
QAINTSRPFGLKIWKPALYKKHRSIATLTENAIHEDPDQDPSTHLPHYLSVGSLLWLFLVGWWLYLVHFLTGCAMLPFALVGHLGLRTLLSWNFAWYMFWPFGKFIIKKRRPTRRFISSLPDLTPPRTAQSTSESAPLLHQHQQFQHPTNGQAFNGGGPSELNLEDSSRYHEPDIQRSNRRARRAMQQQQLSACQNLPWRQQLSLSFNRWWTRIREMGPAGILFRFLAIIILTPVHLFVSLACFLGVFTVPMSRLTFAVLQRLMKLRCLSVRANKDPKEKKKEYRIILCTNHAAGWRYYKYTFDGINIILINLNAIVVFTLFDFYYLGPALDYKGIGSHEAIFLSALISVIPLAYLIGMAVSSITAQTGSLALGSVVNATFGSIVEIILYCLALMEGKTRMVEGSIIGSFMAGLLALPGVSMFFGGLMRKEQKFNTKAAGVTSTLLIMAILGVFGPTFFQGVYGTFELHCAECPIKLGKGFSHKILFLAAGFSEAKDAIGCRQCRYRQPHPTEDPIYMSHTRPLMLICTTVLILMYAIGLFSAGDLMAGMPARAASGAAASGGGGGHGHGGHDHPNWSAWKSAVVLLMATLFFSIIAEVLIDSVDHVIDSGGGKNGLNGDGKWVIDEKILGLTLFAIVPTITEFYNAIAFARQGNIALSLEIGSAYTIQVALLQIPALVAFSEYWRKYGVPADTFTLLFPKWDVFAVLFGVFTVTYLYIEGKSNYFKGAMLLLAYALLMCAFVYAPPELSMDSY